MVHKRASRYASFCSKLIFHAARSRPKRILDEFSASRKFRYRRRRLPSIRRLPQEAAHSRGGSAPAQLLQARVLQPSQSQTASTSTRVSVLSHVILEIQEPEGWEGSSIGLQRGMQAVCIPRRGAEEMLVLNKSHP